jgi:hypothetical protein
MCRACPLKAGNHKVLDKKAFKFGVRQFTYNEDGGALRIFINGRRFVPRGGNWGFSESMLRYRAREYDARPLSPRDELHHDPQLGRPDRRGRLLRRLRQIRRVVWQDFWLANPWDGPIPNDNDLFMSNAKDLILKIRNHASSASTADATNGSRQTARRRHRKDLGELHPGIHYIGSSADKVVSGHGPYQALPPETYFRITDPKLHSEMGMPNIPSLESVQADDARRARCGRRASMGHPRLSASTARRAAPASAASSTRATAAPTAQRNGFPSRSS